MKVELFCEQCPKACENFLALCASNYYDGCLFHRNIKGFIVQTGDPTGKPHLQSIMARRPYLSEEEYPRMAQGKAVSVYGERNLRMNSKMNLRVIDGLETLDELEKLPVNPKTYRPLTDTRLNSVTIHANPFAK
ncbi:peptidyl-prolyl cis-trans isomerase-like 3 isoform X3 [Stegodyphus dumicola]|uniref:peptidyl-prolyl cis-trans isomerase-like 3 isoform X3 n=1 Tax=Stegodyphus dumicola TaxID=202533 RepID=UPI0015AECC94|nr:peptidyl-prolyl cis-trans isomerase-like 3 isoform X3 [Stegodyphus dumicola]